MLKVLLTCKTISILFNFNVYVWNVFSILGLLPIKNIFHTSTFIL